LSYAPAWSTRTYEMLSLRSSASNKNRIKDSGSRRQGGGGGEPR